MTAEFIGSALPRRESELIPPTGPPLQSAFVAELARSHERSRFDSVQIGQTATSLDAVVLAQAVLAATDRLGVVVTLPPDLVDPVAAARAVATLAALYPGRVQARIPVADGDLRRHAELAQVMHGLWHSPMPIDHAGRHYEVHHWPLVRSDPAPRLYVHVDKNPLADQHVVQHADTCFVPAGSPLEVAARIAGLRDLAGGRTLRFGIAVRPIVGADDEAVEALSGRVIRSSPTWKFDGDPGLSRAGHTRVLAAVTRAHGSARPFVGSVAEITVRLREYQAVGVDVFHLRGFDPLADVATFGAIAGGVRTRGPVEQQRGELVHHVA